MKNKIGFNIIFAILALPIGMAMLRNFDFHTFAFKKTILGIIYLVGFIACFVLMLKKKNSN
ncbi:hypothetical protein [Zunongwangia endophytica]|uniref:Uncharacterized protein n=1 Tax=Zunongwangia endophytica TaxID=1808945 RepID=A0ABV8HCG3_9FLAO|nr:hypothetical protein [Zunongwangia endophytica]MDN3594174.1 hypothetical protein [Zunongwangia endophytica]